MKFLLFFLLTVVVNVHAGDLTLSEVEGMVKTQKASVDIAEYTKQKELAFKQWYVTKEPQLDQVQMFNKIAKKLGITVGLMVVETDQVTDLVKNSGYEKLILSKLPIAIRYLDTLYLRKDFLDKVKNENFLAVLIAHELSHDDRDALVREFLAELSKAGQISELNKSSIRMEQEFRADEKSFALLKTANYKINFSTLEKFWQLLVDNNFASGSERKIRLANAKALA